MENVRAGTETQPMAGSMVWKQNGYLISCKRQHISSSFSFFFLYPLKSCNLNLRAVVRSKMLIKIRRPCIKFSHEWGAVCKAELIISSEALILCPTRAFSPFWMPNFFSYISGIFLDCSPSWRCLVQFFLRPPPPPAMIPGIGAAAAPFPLLTSLGIQELSPPHIIDKRGFVNKRWEKI